MNALKGIAILLALGAGFLPATLLLGSSRLNLILTITVNYHSKAVSKRVSP